VPLYHSTQSSFSDNFLPKMRTFAVESPKPAPRRMSSSGRHDKTKPAISSLNLTLPTPKTLKVFTQCEWFMENVILAFIYTPQ